LRFSETRAKKWGVEEMMDNPMNPREMAKPLTYLGPSLAKKLKQARIPPQLPKPIWKALPTLRLKCPPTVDRGY